eukprot:GEMP01002452.1.p1 GENE.GEMP01002452.1~~GEMP01002452.1.p1  ORF type:complete len:1242 (+),score=298.08 GEMP01002452.1:179-3904(+)
MATEKTAKQVLDKTAQRRAEKEAAAAGGKELMTGRSGKLPASPQNAVVTDAVTGTDDVAVMEADESRVTAVQHASMVHMKYDPIHMAALEQDLTRMSAAEYDHTQMAAAEYDPPRMAAVEYDHTQMAAAEYDPPQMAAAEHDHTQMAAAKYTHTQMTAMDGEPTQITATDYKPMLMADYDPTRLIAIPEFTPTQVTAVPEFTPSHLSEYVPNQMVVVPEFTPSHMVAQPDFSHYNSTQMVAQTPLTMGMQNCAGYNYCSWPVYPCYPNMYDGYVQTGNAPLTGCQPSELMCPSPNGQMCSTPEDIKEPSVDTSADTAPPPPPPPPLPLHAGNLEDTSPHAPPAARTSLGVAPGNGLREDAASVVTEMPQSEHVEVDPFSSGYNGDQGRCAEVEPFSRDQGDRVEVEPFSPVYNGELTEGKSFSGYNEECNDACKYHNISTYVGQSKHGLNPDAAEWSQYGVAENHGDTVASSCTWDANQYYYYVPMPCYGTTSNYTDYTPMPHGWTTGEPEGAPSSWTDGGGNGTATWTQLPNMPQTEAGNTVVAEEWPPVNDTNAADGEEEDEWSGKPQWWAPPAPPIPEAEEWAAVDPEADDWTVDVDDRWSPVPPSEACASAQDDKDEWAHGRHSTANCAREGAGGMDHSMPGSAEDMNMRWKDDTGDEWASSSRSGFSKGNDLGKELNNAGHAVLSLRDVNKMEALNLEMPTKKSTWLEDRSERRERERSKLRRYSFMKEIRSEHLAVTPDGSDSEATPTTSAGSDLHQAKSFIEVESYVAMADEPPTYTRQELLQMRLPKSDSDFCGLRAMSQQQHKKKAERRKRRDRGEDRYRDREDRYWDRQTSSYSFSSWQPLAVPAQKSQPLKRWKSGGHMEELKRSCQSLLNKICPENLATIVPQLANLAISDAKDIELVIGLIFKKALLEPHYSDTYCDMVFSLRDKFPHFPEADKSRHKDEIVSFTRVLVHTCQHEFELLQSEDFAALDEDELMIRKQRCLAHMKLLGSLYLRTLLSHKVIKIVCEDLLRGKPAEHLIQCACALVQSLGYAFESEKGPDFVNNIVKRLGELLETGAYGKRIQFMVKDLLDLRANNWQQKKFEAKAGEATKLKEVARSTSEKYSLAGARPEYMCSEESFADHLLQQMKDEKEVSSSFVNTFASLPAIRQQKIVNIMTHKGLTDIASSRRHRYDDNKSRHAEGAIRQLNLDIDVLKAVSIDMRKEAADYYAYPAAANFCDRIEQLINKREH